MLKPGKNPEDAKSYRPISLLCHCYKLFERLILNRMLPVLEDNLIPEQAGFRPGKSCTGQLLNLAQFIEDGFQRKLKTGVVFVDLTAAFDTVNHRALLGKIYSFTNGDQKLTNIIQCLLSNRRFYVDLNGKKSRWRVQKNGVPQGSVLAPSLFNIYTNDQPITINTRSFIYADDLAIATQASTFEKIQLTISTALSNMSSYYKDNSLRANPSKTQICAFHLSNKEAMRTLDVKWNGVTITHTAHPVYLGVTLDRTLSYKKHVMKTKAKISARNSIISKLANSKWGACPTTIRTSALALCYSVAT